MAEEVDLKREQPGGVRVFPGIWWHGGGEPVGGTPQPLPGALGVCLLREEIRDRSLQQDWHQPHTRPSRGFCFPRLQNAHGVQADRQRSHGRGRQLEIVSCKKCIVM